MERRDHIKSGCYIMEIQILHWFETLHNPITNPIFYVITTLGNTGWFWIVLAVLMLTVLPKKYKKAGLTMAIALILSLIFCNGIMKHLWARPRAFWVVGQNFVVGNEFENLYGIFNSIHDYSFPSGHSSASFAAAVSIFMWRKKEGSAALVLAALIAGVILAGILAATMSTSDSQLLTAASGVSQNILHDFFHVEMDEKKSLFTARLTIIGISIVSIFMARNPNSSVFGIVSFAWAGFGASFGAVMLCALFWRRSTLAGALSGMVAGGVMVFVWKYLVRPLGGALDIYELLPAFLVSLAVIIIVSLLTNKPSDKVLAEFDKAAGK